MKKVINVDSSDQTESIASKIGANLRGGETIELVSDVGGGKTTFTRGLVRGAGSRDHVSSPTFTISNIYQAPKFAICHFDFYRLPEAGIIEHQLHEDVELGRDVLVVEWSDVVKEVLPKNRLSIHIKSTSDEGREFEFDCSKELEYLIDDVDTDN